MFSKSFCETVTAAYARRSTILGDVIPALEEHLLGCTPQEAILVRWYYATMPIGDAGAYPPALFWEIARHALRVRAMLSWCADLPEAVFLRDVAYYRINSEKIELSGPFFFTQLLPLVEGKSLRAAVLEINYWCARHAAYAASDGRTASPMTVYRSGRGRCGEESTFLVAALRSVGIAARQVYTPRWAHCDDNHAWVEAYVDGKWNFLGACEPEEVLNRGWFAAAASRALLLHARSFAAQPTEGAGEKIGSEGVTTFYNATPLYADTKRLCLHVKTAEGIPVESAQVVLEIINMAEFFPLATLCTNQNGNVEIVLGKGDVMVCVRKENLFAQQLCKAEQVSCTIVLARQQTEFWQQQTGWLNENFTAPPAAKGHGEIPTAQQRVTHLQRMAQTAQQRAAWIASGYDAQKAKDFSNEEALLHRASGNFKTLVSFLTKDNSPMRAALLHSLAEKDLLDVSEEILETHLQGALTYRHCVRMGTNPDGTARMADAADEIFVPYVLCPRVLTEELTAFRDDILSFFSAQQQQAFLQSPQAVWQWIEQNVGYDAALDYKTLLTTPKAVLRLRQGNAASRTVLFVAVCRTFAIPARANPVTLQPEYYENGIFVPVETNAEQRGDTTLLLTAGQSDEWNYYKTWTLGYWNDNRFETLDYTGIAFENGTLTLKNLRQGRYRLVCTTRMPNGSQYARVWTGVLAGGKTTRLELALPQGTLQDFLMENALEEVAVQDENGSETTLRAFLNTGNAMVAFLEEGAEPTEHVLNELIEQQDVLRANHVAPVFVLRSRQALQNATLAKLLLTLPEIRCCYADFNQVLEPVARQMFTDHEKLPLLMVTRGDFVGRYACSGYNVGSIALCLKILRALQEEAPC